MSIICTAAALYDYVAGDDDEHSLNKGEVVNVISKQEDGWWNVIKTSGTAVGKEGLIPSNYVYVKVNASENKEMAPTSYLPPGWESSIDKESGERYYYNKASGQVQWSAPGAGGDSGDDHPKVQLNNFMEHKAQGARNDNHGNTSTVGRSVKGHSGAGAVKMTSSDLADFKRLREDADAKLADLRKVLSYQENLHLLESKQLDGGGTHANSGGGQLPSKPPGVKGAQGQASPRTRGFGKGVARAIDNNSNGRSNATGSSVVPSNLRLDPVSLRAIARIVDDKIEHRDDLLLGKMKAIVETATSPVGSPLKHFSPDRSSQPHSDTHSSHFSTGMHAMNTHGSKYHASPSNQSTIQHNGKSGERKPWVGSTSRLPTEGVAGASLVSAVDGDRVGKRVPFRVSRYDVSNHKATTSDGVRYPQCRSAVYPPSTVDDGTGVSADELVDTSQPSAGLVLDHVYAYSGDSSRHSTSIRGKNIMFLDNNRIIYPAAALVIIMEVGSQNQSFFSGHTEDVTCITVHPDRTIAASGQLGKDGRVLIWDSSAIEPGAREYSAAVELLMLGGTRGVCGLNFSGDGRFLVALGMDESHSMVIFDWANAQVIASVKVGNADVNQMGFNPFLFAATDRLDELKMPTTPREQRDKSESCCYTLVSCGGRQIKFWTLRRTLEKEDERDLPTDLGGFKGRKIAFPKKKQHYAASYTLEGNTAVFPKTATDVPDILCFVCVNDGEGGSRDVSAPRSRIFTGTSTGAVYIWQQLEDVRNKNSLTHYSWQPKGRLLSVVSDVHESPILDLDYTGAYWYSDDRDENTNERLITCSQDGITNVWRMDRTTGSESSGVPFDHLSTINIGYSESHVGAPRCVSWDLDGTTAVVGTTANALLRLHGEGLSSGDSSHEGSEHLLQPHVYVTSLVRGHHGKILRVAAHPTEPIFATISTDKTVRLWDSRRKTQVALTRLADRASAVEFTPDGTALAIGNESGEVLIVKYVVLENYQGGSSAKHNRFHGSGSEEDLGGVAQGTVLEKQWQVVLRRHVAAKTVRAPPVSTLQAGNSRSGDQPESFVSASTASLLAKKKSEVMEVRFSPDGEVLAVGCRDNLIHLLSISNGYRRAAVCRGHSSYIRNMDFSSDGRVLRSTDAVRELLFWEVATGKQIVNASHTRDLEWDTGKCSLGWHVQGVFNGSAGVPIDGDVNAVCRSKNGKLLVAGSSNTVNNAVKLFRYPCISKAVPSLHGGHTSPVLDTTFLACDDQVVTIGGSDSTIFSWSLRT